MIIWLVHFENLAESDHVDAIAEVKVSAVITGSLEDSVSALSVDRGHTERNITHFVLGWRHVCGCGTSLS